MKDIIFVRLESAQRNCSLVLAFFEQIFGLLRKSFFFQNYFNSTYEGKLIKAITRITNTQRLGFSYSFIIYKDTKTKKMILYESSIMN